MVKCTVSKQSLEFLCVSVKIPELLTKMKLHPLKHLPVVYEYLRYLQVIRGFLNALNICK